MSYPRTEIDKIGLQLWESAEDYARTAEALAGDPYFREAIVKIAVSSFAWKLFHAFDGWLERNALSDELALQGEAIDRANVAGCEVPAASGRFALQAVDHVQLAIPSGGEDKARAFYSALLGLAEAPKPVDLAKRGGCWFEGAVKVHCGVEEPFRPARKAHIAFRVDDVAALASRARQAGFEVKADTDLPGHERVFIFDPFGNRLEFLRPVGS